MPLWGWLVAAGVAWLLLGGAPSRGASTSQGDVSNRTPEDWQALWAWAGRLNTTPDVIGLVLYEESGMDPGASNPAGCYGINQFCKPGGTYDAWVDVPPEQYVTMSMAQQLDYVGPFWASKPSWSTARDLLWLNFVPATYQQGASADTVVTSDPGFVAANQVYSQGRSVITAGDLDAVLASQAASPGWQLALQKIADNSPDAVG